MADPLLPEHPGAVLLMVGLLPDDAGAEDVVRSAGRNGYAGVITKCRGRSLISLVNVASEAGIAVLQVADETAWTGVDAVVASVIGAAGLGAGPSRADAAADLHAAANAVASVFGGSVAIEDLDRKVLAYSSIPGQRIDALREAGILQRLVPMGPNDRREYHQIFASPTAVRFPLQGEELPRSAVAVRAGGVPLGSIWAIESEEGATEQQLQTLEESARVVSVHLLRLRHADEIGQLARGDALVSLLDNNVPSETLMARIGLAPGPARLLLLSTADPAERSQLHVVTAAAGRYLLAYSPGAVVASLPGWTCLLVPEHGAKAAEKLAVGIHAETSRAVGSEVRVAYSSAAIFPQGLAAMFAEVMEVASVAAATRYPLPVVHVSDIADQLLLKTVNDAIAERPLLANAQVDALMDYDVEHRSALAPTLLAWIEEQGDPRKAAQRLSIHSNTVRYRVRRALEVTGGEPVNADARLALWIHLRRRVRLG